VICASNQDLRELISSGGFREDLYYRLNGLTLELPTLAARADKDALINRFLKEEAGGRIDSSGSPGSNSIDPQALRCLTQYHWPGNIRELRNVIRSAFAICDDNVIRLDDLPAELRVGQRRVSVENAPGNALAHAERETLLKIIRANHGNLVHTATQLGISRNALYRRLKRHGITISRVDGLSVGSAP
jgi:transcriptional regulator of acetoin/glycerol metabolism